MSDAVAFLTALGQVLATSGLYGEGHPARVRARQGCAQALDALLADGEPVRLSFVGGDVIFGQRILRELRQWEWGPRLAAIGIEQLEFRPPVSPADLTQFLGLVHDRLQLGAADAPLLAADPATGIRFGRVTVGTGVAPEPSRSGSDAADYDLTAEISAIRWVREEVAGSDRLPVVETETIVRSLALAMRQQGELVLPLLELGDLDQYAVAHASNVTVLAMGLAEYLGYAPREGRVIGVAAMLADIGTTRLPAGLLAKPGALAGAERELMMTHCAEGARLLLERHSRMELAAVVAYEHHLDLDGGGYPALAIPRTPHFVSRLVRICDVYDAVVSPRPWRATLSPDEAMILLEEGVGTRFDADLVIAFTTMLRLCRVVGGEGVGAGGRGGQADRRTDPPPCPLPICPPAVDHPAAET